MKIALDPAAAPKQWIPFENWLRQFGRTRQTGHRWMRELPWLKAETINILGRLYISAEGARRFVDLAAAGKLAGRGYVPPPPPRGPKQPLSAAAARALRLARRRNKSDSEPARETIGAAGPPRETATPTGA